ncbi:hypothetical protein KEM52_001739 [Ascosphaera acerosa]|nr:hypothetical protein KEM52_001739 [Ascosphaera acerosa]
MDEPGTRLFRFSRPQWMNNANVRTAGIYTSGALVSSNAPTSATTDTATSNHRADAALLCSPTQFSMGLFFMVDAAAMSRSAYNGSDVHVRFVDWIPAICSALGMLVINSIEKSLLSADSFSYSGGGVAWKARFVLFLGFALLAGGLAGSVVCPTTSPGDWMTVLIIKYAIENYPFEQLYYGIANVVANGLVMLSTVVLWVSQNIEDDYTYNLAL